MENATTGKPGLMKARTVERIDTEMAVNASLEDVWHAWTTDEGVRTFFAKQSNVKLALGGHFIFAYWKITYRTGVAPCKAVPRGH